jgi:hypothetical protein
MKTILMSSLTLATLLVGCGGDKACCNTSKALSHNQGTDEQKGNSINEPPIAAITGLGAKSTIPSDKDFRLDGASSSDSDGSIVSYDWSVDGKPYSKESNPSFNLPSGSHEICLSVTDNNGLSTQECKTVDAIATHGTPQNTEGSEETSQENNDTATEGDSTQGEPSTGTEGDTAQGAQTKVPVAVITLSDSDKMMPLYSNHTFSCDESYDEDDIGKTPEIASCDWDIKSYQVKDGIEVPLKNCSVSNQTKKEIKLCDHVVKIVAKLTVTDNDGQKNTTIKTYYDNVNK